MAYKFDLSDSAAKLPRLMSLQATGKFGYSCGFGAMRYGYVCFGFFDEYAGIYQRKHGKDGKTIARQKFYHPSNPQTPAQQAWRAVFSAGLAQYLALTSDEKMRLSKKARNLRMTGHNLFLRDYLRRNRILP